MDFVAIDFETANMQKRHSACALGLVVVQQSRIVEEKYLLIKPETEFDYYCVRVHGITPAMVAEQPTFRECWPEIVHYFDGKNLIAHNASFDFSVYRHCMEHANLSSPFFKYFCTYKLFKKWLPGLPSYSLDMLAEHLGIPFQHHHALEDARTAAKLMIHMQDHVGIGNLDELSAHLGCIPGFVVAGGYQSFR